MPSLHRPEKRGSYQIFPLQGYALVTSTGTLITLRLPGGATLEKRSLCPHLSKAPFPHSPQLPSLPPPSSSPMATSLWGCQEWESALPSLLSSSNLYLHHLQTSVSICKCHENAAPAPTSASPAQCKDFSRERTTRPIITESWNY